MKLVIGNKNYSSWSLRPWLVLKAAGIPFEEELIPLYRDDTAVRLAQASPSGKVPVLVDGAVTVWESLAICDYLADKFPEKQLWPKDPAVRAVARSVSQEMHAGFAALRSNLPCNFRRTPTPIALPEEVRRDVARIQEIWADCRKRFGAGGPFLFGKFSIADAMYAPVASRFKSYAVPLDPTSGEYVAAIFAMPQVQEWAEAGRIEPWTLPASEK